MPPAGYMIRRGDIVTGINVLGYPYRYYTMVRITAGKGEGWIKPRNMHLNREEYRLIKRMSRGELQDYLEEVSGELEKEAIRKEALLDARESLEKAIDIKGLGPMRKAEIRKKYKKKWRKKEHGRKTGAAGGC